LMDIIWLHHLIEWL